MTAMDRIKEVIEELMVFIKYDMVNHVEVLDMINELIGVEK